MAKNKNQPKSDNPSLPAAKSSVSSAVTASMPIMYSAQIAHAQQISGPLPSPDLLKKYEEVQPGLVDRIVKMAEDEAAHRRTVESEIIAIQGRDQTSYRRSELVGQFCGLTIGLAAIAASVMPRCMVPKLLPQ